MQVLRLQTETDRQTVTFYGLQGNQRKRKSGNGSHCESVDIHYSKRHIVDRHVSQFQRSQCYVKSMSMLCQLTRNFIFFKEHRAATCRRLQAYNYKCTQVDNAVQVFNCNVMQLQHKLHLPLQKRPHTTQLTLTIDG